MSVAQSCPTPCNPMDCSPPGSSVHGILQARTLEWVATSFSRGSSWPRFQTQVSCIPGGCFTVWVTGLPWSHYKFTYKKWWRCYVCKFLKKEMGSWFKSNPVSNKSCFDSKCSIVSIDNLPYSKRDSNTTNKNMNGIQQITGPMWSQHSLFQSLWIFELSPGW